MKYLVVGTLPPPRSAASAALLACVDRLEGDGHEVTVVPVGVGRPGARTGGLAGRAGTDVLAAVARGARRHDRIVVQLEPGLAGSVEAGRARRAASLVALGGALRAWKDVELRLESFDDVPGGVGGRAAGALWSAAGRVVVPTPEQRDALHQQARVPLERITVEAPPLAAAAADLAGPGWPSAELVTRDAVLAVVRRRAAADRVDAGWHPSPAVSRMLAESSGPPPSPFGPFEPVVRAVYERPGLRALARRLLRRPTCADGRREGPHAPIS